MLNKASTFDITDLIFDLDNTTWSFTNMFVKAQRAMVEFLVNESGYPQSVIENEIRQVKSNAGTLDYPFVVQNIPILHGPNSMDLAMGSKAVFDGVCAETFIPYSNVHSTLEEIQQRGINMHVFTDAPLTRAVWRLSAAGLGKYFDNVFVQKDPTLQSPYSRALVNMHYHDEYNLATLPNTKPNLDLSRYLHIPQKEIPKRVGVVGDNWKKDMGLANINGCYGFFAEYGQPTPEELSALSAMSEAEAVSRSVNMSGGIDIIDRSKIEFLRFSIQELLKYLRV
ncbi:hypothetical protein JW758_03670 [Candidatus Peregrinibacteria bacterium]|nr:hypothetical protein [Candidatus Peregrinibacteria bacterium]